MKKYFRSRMAAMVLVLSVAFMSVQCGYILHPEREGQKSGKIDVPILIMDCAWLIAGIVPGVIALGVDFYTGCIYEPGTMTKAGPGDSLGLRLRGEAPLDSEVSVNLKSAEGDFEKTLFEQSFDRGQENEEPFIFTIPERLEEGQYEISINVNGIENAAWPLNVQ